MCVFSARLASLGAEQVDGAVARQRREPRPGAAARSIEGRRFAPRAHKGVLHHVFGVRVRSHDAQRQREQRRAKTIVERQQRAVVAAACALDELLWLCLLGDVVHARNFEPVP